MITLSMIAVTVAVLLAAMAILSVVATREPTLIPATVNPEGRIGAFMEPRSGSQLESAAASEWNMIELNNIFSVEALLDTLEASNASSTEVELAGEDKFTVRWR